MEGVAFNPKVPDTLYLAMSSIANGMTDGQDDIDLTQNYCGIVYRMTMAAPWNVNRIDPAIIGAIHIFDQYECDINNLAGPDNLLVLDDGRCWSARTQESMRTTWFGCGGGQQRPGEQRKHHRQRGKGYQHIFGQHHAMEAINTKQRSAASIWPHLHGDCFGEHHGAGEMTSMWVWNGIESSGEQYDRTFHSNPAAMSLKLHSTNGTISTLMLATPPFSQQQARTWSLA